MRILSALFVMLLLTAASCSKKCDEKEVLKLAKLDYGTSVLYVKETSYTVAPLIRKAGTYTAFPNTLAIDRNSGEITVSPKDLDGEYQAGLRYKITFKSNLSGETDSTFITLSGLSYVDKFYNLSQGDSIIYPIYNGDVVNSIPGGNYDLTGDNKFAINPVNGQINIKETIRRGYFNNQINTSWKQQDIKYQINDGSNNAKQTISVIIYYYSTINDVPKNVSALMQAHQAMSVGVNRSVIPSTTAAIDNNIPSELSLAKPRPPCIIIIGH